MSSNDTDETGEQLGNAGHADAGVLPGDEDCALDRFVRNRYFHGKLMTARDMQLEQAYHADRLETQAQHATGEGAVCGLSTTVEQARPDADLEVTVERGYALDRCGRPVLVDDTAHESFPPDGEGYDLPPPDAEPAEGELPPGVAVYVRLKECQTERVPIPGSEDACREDCTYNRVVEDFEVEIDGNPPDPKSVRDVEFPERSELETYDEETGPDGSDPGLQKMARTYHEDDSRERFQYRLCEEEGDPRVFLGYYARQGTDWQLLAEAAPRHQVYTNDMLYAAVARHATDFGNPHDVVTSVDGVEHEDGNVELVSEDGSVVSEPGSRAGTVNLEVAGGVQTDLHGVPEYVRDKVLKYTVEVFYEVAERYAGDEDFAQAVNVRARAIILAAREALARAVFEDEFRFAAAVLYLASLEWEIRDRIRESLERRRPLASEESFEYYARTLEKLADLLPGDLAAEFVAGDRFEEFTGEFLDRLRQGGLEEEFMREFLDLVEEVSQVLEEEHEDALDATELAVIQDQVAEAAGWLERAEEPETMVLPGGEQEVDARIIRLAIDRPGGVD